MYEFLKPKEASEILKVSKQTLRRWEKNGKIKAVRTSGPKTHRRYDIRELVKQINDNRTNSRKDLPRKLKNLERKNKRQVCYTRVSSHDQKADLERQKKFLQERFPDHEIISDIGSGLNFKRKGFKTILEYSIQGTLGEVVVANKDRLCRFGYELIEFYFKELSGAKIVVLNKTSHTPYDELVEDILSITTVFSSKLYGLRSGKAKRNRKEKRKKEKEKRE